MISPPRTHSRNSIRRPWTFGRVTLLTASCSAAMLLSVGAQQSTLENPIIYVNQVPITEPSKTLVAIGGSHLGNTKSAPRGGDLMIRYQDGALKNLTRLAGYGESGTLQAEGSIAVRDPQVHWSGNRAVFSMVVGAPTSANDNSVFYWQLYEVSGLGQTQTPTVTKIVGQPENFNNIQPTYGTRGEIIFVSDRTLDGGRALYPAIDEQGTAKAVTGLWKLDRTTGTVNLLEHSPSGSFSPTVDSFGRVVFSRWDHLQRDAVATSSGGIDYESETSSTTSAWSDVYPEPMTASDDTLGHKFDLFLPWTMNQDGTELLTMNHLGRHELNSEVRRSTTDEILQDFFADVDPFLPGMLSPTRAGSYLQIKESPSTPGKYIATDASAISIAAGRLVTFTSPPDGNPDQVVVQVANNFGIARDPSYLDNGQVMASFIDTGEPIFGSYGSDSIFVNLPGNIGPEFLPEPDSPFTIRITNDPHSPIGLMDGWDPVPETSVTVTNYVDGSAVTFTGKFWQLQPVEVRGRPIPQIAETKLDPIETDVFRKEGISIEAMKTWLRENELALLVTRNVTSRDHNDRQQPYNLRVPGGVMSRADGGDVYSVTNLQFFQGDYLRGYTQNQEAPEGRRIKPNVMHDDKAENLPTDIEGSAPIASDGSMAAFVPAKRALTWQLTDEEGSPVVRERFWLSFQAGEIRTCANCHGTNTSDQLGRGLVTNSPLALKNLLADWNSRHPEVNASVTPYQFWAETTISPVGAPADGDADVDGLSNMEEFIYGSNPNLRNPEGSQAIPLTPGMTSNQELVLTFTQHEHAATVPVRVEYSSNLSDWNQAASIAGDVLTSEQGVSLLSSASPEQTSQKLKQYQVTISPTALGGRAKYFRLKFDESE